MQDGIEFGGAEVGADHEGCHFLFFFGFQIDEGFDIGVIDIEDLHFGRPPRGAAGLNRASRRVADFQE